MDLNKSLKVALAQKGKNQSWLAEQMSISNSAVSKICLQNKAGTHRLQRTCEVLDIKLSELIALGESE